MNQSYVVASCDILMEHLKRSMSANRKIAEGYYETFVQNNVRSFPWWKTRTAEQVRKTYPFDTYYAQRWSEEIRLTQTLYGMIQSSSDGKINLTIQDAKRINWQVVD